MEKKDIHSRREFFKKATKTVLPIIGLFILSSPRQILQAKTPHGCKSSYVDVGGGSCSSCYRTCKSSCSDACTSCQGNCEGDCVGNCYTTCQGNCKGECSGSCHNSCSGSSRQ